MFTFSRSLFILAIIGCCSAAPLAAQPARIAAIAPTVAPSALGPLQSVVTWVPTGSTDAATVSTVWLSSGLTEGVSIEGGVAAWSILSVDTAAVEHELRQVVTVDSVRLLTTAYIRSDRSRSVWELPRRSVLIVLDHATAVAVSNELDRWVDDLRREGWLVRLVPVAATDSPRQIKAEIYRTLASLPAAIDRSAIHVCLMGDVPYATSGGYSVRGVIPNPDFHPEHGGAWASDAYYADIETSPGVDAEYQWTDSSVAITDPETAQRRENQNMPGDGKFDQSILPSDLELCVGRIDMRDLPVFSTPERPRSATDLLRHYLDKNHRYRAGLSQPPDRAPIDDCFGLFSRTTSSARITEAFAASAWRSFAPIVGAAHITVGDWIVDTTRSVPSLDTLQTLLAYGCGGGGYEHCSGVGTSAEFAQQPLHSVFTLLFGSYFGDVHSTNNLMRSALAAEGWTLTCGWSGRPHWFLHPLAAGSTIGECQRLTANNNGTYVGSSAELFDTGTFVSFPLGTRNVHTLLLGDPTLTLQGPTIPGELSAELEGGWRRVTLSWTRAPEDGRDSASNVIYVVESAASVDSVFQTIDTVGSTRDTIVRTTVTVPLGSYVIRVRPVYTAAGRLSLLPGRGLMTSLPVLNVAEVSQNEQESQWIAVDLRGQILGTHHGTATTFRESLHRNHDIRGFVLLTNGIEAVSLLISP